MAPDPTSAAPASRVLSSPRVPGLVAPPVGPRDKPGKPEPPAPPTPEAPTWRASYGRLLVATVLLAGALYHALVTLRQPDVLRGLADLTLLDVYRTLVLRVVLPSGRAFVVLLVAFHVAAALGVLWRGRVVRGALVGVFAFLVALIPALGVYNTMNVPLLLLVGLLLMETYPATVREALRRRRG